MVVSETAAYPCFGGLDPLPMTQPPLRPSPGRHEGSSGHVVAQRWLRWGLTCHHARLALGSIVKRVCAGAREAMARRATSRVIRMQSPSVYLSRCDGLEHPERRGVTRIELQPAPKLGCRLVRSA